MRAMEEMLIVVSSTFLIWRSSLPRISIGILMEVFQPPQMRAVEEMLIVVAFTFFFRRSSLPRISFSISIFMEVFQPPQMRAVEEVLIVISPFFSRSSESSLLKLEPLRSSEGCWYEEQHLAVRYVLELKLPLRVSTPVSSP